MAREIWHALQAAIGKARASPSGDQSCRGKLDTQRDPSGLADPVEREWGGASHCPISVLRPECRPGSLNDRSNRS
jgi:hypothetical protein